MGTYERRTKIWEILRQRKSDTVENLAEEFGVSERTIRRDISTMLSTHPITTICGRYGGVMVLDTALPGYFNKKQEEAVRKLISVIRETAPDALDEAELMELENLLKYYIKPQSKQDALSRK